MPNLTRRAAMAGATLAVASTVPAVSATSALSAGNPDPIFPAIERHEAAWRTFSEFVRTQDDANDDTPGYDEASQAETAAMVECFETVPTTVAGCAAKTRHLSRELQKFMTDDRHVVALRKLSEALDRLA